MRKLKTAATAVAFLAASSLAALADQASGTIKSIDTSAMTVTLADGTTYMLPPGADTASLQVGEKVQIKFTTNMYGQPQASSIQPAA